MRVAILDDYQDVALKVADWASLGSGVEVVRFTNHLDDVDELAARLADFECVCLMRERTPVRADLIAKLPKLKLLITAGGNNASVDVPALTARGIQFCGTGGGSTSTQELAFALIMNCARQIPQEVLAVREGGWQIALGQSLSGKTLGLIGLGRLGGAVAKFAAAFGMKLIAWSQNLTAERCAEYGATLVDKETLFRDSDFISIHMVLSDRSRGLVGAAELALMKPTAYLINTSRGPLVDEAALIASLRANRIGGAGLDVFDQEPLPLDHPFRTMPNVIVTPHIGFVADDGYRAFYVGMVEDIQAFLDGKLLRPINKLG